MYLRITFASLFLLSILASSAQAKSARKVSYSYDKVWPTAVRFLRIDEGLKITEKDKDTGYVLFVLSDEGKNFKGSMELVRSQREEQRSKVEIVIQIKGRPSYMESAILDRMKLKIREELGLPKDLPPKKDNSDDDKDPDKDSKPDKA